VCGFPVYSAPHVCVGTEQKKEPDMCDMCVGTEQKEPDMCVGTEQKKKPDMCDMVFLACLIPPVCQNVYGVCYRLWGRGGWFLARCWILHQIFLPQMC
jgi:hypothetical protein